MDLYTILDVAPLIEHEVSTLKAGCCCFGGFLCGFMLAAVVLLSVVSVVFGLLALPLATWLLLVLLYFPVEQ